MNKHFFLFAVIFLVLLAIAGSFTPPSDFDGRGVRAIYNVTDINLTRLLCIDSTCITAWTEVNGSGATADGFWDITTSNYLINNTAILDLNETKLNATIDARGSDTTYTAGNSYLYLVSTAFWLNDTVLNATIDARDSDTQLSEAQVDAFVANDGYINETWANATYYLDSNPDSFIAAAAVPAAETDAAHDECSEISSCVSNAWDADGDISADEISESKINFATACAAGNHLYVSGNDLACEADTFSGTVNRSQVVENWAFCPEGSAQYGENETGRYCDATFLNNTDTAALATALAANGANCAAGEYPLGVDASGAIESCTDATTEINTALSGYWDADGDLAADEISESKINFATACAAGNHYYLSGNDLACESDDDTTYTAGNGIALSGTEFTVAGGTALTADAGGLSVTDGAIGDTQLAFNTGQALTSTTGVTFLTVDTGYGANELWDMDQHVLKASDVTFVHVNATGNVTIGGCTDTWNGTCSVRVCPTSTFYQC